MKRPIRSLSTRCFASLALAVAPLAATTGLAAGDGSDDSGPTYTTSSDPEDLEGFTVDVDSLESHTQNVDDLTGETKDPDDLVAGTRDPDTLSGSTRDLDDLVGESHELSDLPREAPERPDPPIEVEGQANWQPTTDLRVLAARRQLLSAQKRVREARARYAEMMHENYPRGDERAAIVREREEAEKALAVAKRALDQVGIPAAIPH